MADEITETMVKEALGRIAHPAVTHREHEQGKEPTERTRLEKVSR
jgi:hypothetical protein